MLVLLQPLAQLQLEDVPGAGWSVGDDLAQDEAELEAGVRRIAEPAAHAAHDQDRRPVVVDFLDQHERVGARSRAPAVVQHDAAQLVAEGEAGQGDRTAGTRPPAGEVPTPPRPSTPASDPS